MKPPELVSAAVKVFFTDHCHLAFHLPVARFSMRPLPDGAQLHMKTLPWIGMTLFALRLLRRVRLCRRVEVSSCP